MKYIEEGANLTRKLVQEGRYAEATEEWGNTEMRIMQVSDGVDFYNVLKKISGYGRSKLIL